MALIVPERARITRECEMAPPPRYLTPSSSSPSVIPVAADTICLHGDTPGAATLARHVRSVLESAGVAIRALAHAGQS